MLVILSNRKDNIEEVVSRLKKQSFQWSRETKNCNCLRKIKHSWSLIRSSNNILNVLYMNLTRKATIWLMRRT